MIGIVNLKTVLLLTWCVTFSIGILILMGLNIWFTVWYFQKLKITGSMTGKAAAAWIISIASMLTGPLFFIAALVSIVLGVSQLSSSQTQATRIAAGFAIVNVVFILVWMACLIAMLFATR